MTRIQGNETAGKTFFVSQKEMELPFLVQFWCRWGRKIRYIGLDGTKPLDSLD
jgi:hypothetical protein